MRNTTLTLAATLATVFLFSPCFAHAQPVPDFLLPFTQSANLLTLSASANDQVAQDVVTITLFYEQKSDDPHTLPTVLKQHLDAALQKTKNVNGISVSTGQSTQFTSSTDERGSHTTWQGRVEISLESKDFAAAAKLAGELAPDMQVGSVRFSPSPETLRAAEDKLSREAIASFRKKAAAAVHALGYRDYTIRQVNLTSGPEWAVADVTDNTSTPLGKGASMDIPLKGGMSTVTVTVTGSVQMK